MAENMSSIELPISCGRAGDGENVQPDGNHIKTASLKMLEIAEKLKSLNQQLHNLEVDNKGMLAGMVFKLRADKFWRF